MLPNVDHCIDRTLAVAPALTRSTLLLLLLFVAGCETARPPAAPGVLAPLEPARGSERYRVDAQRSSLVVKVYRAGTMAELGHNHIVSSTQLEGEVYRARRLEQSVFELRVPVDGFDIDLPERRAAAGDDFPGVLDPEAIEGTRANMLGERQLDAARWPVITVRGRAAEVAADDRAVLRVPVDIAVRDRVHRMTIPVQFTEQSDGSLTGSGAFSVLQSELGLEPFSVMMGALKVRDQLDIEVAITAVPQ